MSLVLGQKFHYYYPTNRFSSTNGNQLLKAIIVDDEAPLRAVLKSLIRVYHKDIEIVAEAGSVESGFEVINTHQPDLVFLDVEIINGTGFDLLAKFPVIDFKIIFVTAHNAYAIRAFKYSAVDYLLKPVDSFELDQAIQKVKDSFKTDESNISLKALLDNIKRESGPKRVLLKDHESIHLIETDEIIRCEAEGNYTRFYLKNGKHLLISKTLKDFDNLLSTDQFFRAHQSHLINLGFFLRFDKANGGTIVLKDGSTLPVATRKKDQLIERLEAYTK